MLHQLIRKLRHSTWPETTAEVQICHYHPSPERLGDPPYYGVNFTYTVDGKQYNGGLESEAAVQPGDKFSIRYNPTHPERNSSEPYGDWEKYYDAVFVLVLAGFILWFYLTHKG